MTGVVWYLAAVGFGIPATYASGTPQRIPIVITQQSRLPADTALYDLVAAAKLRCRIERDYRELKQELGLGHFEGRDWRGLDHRASLCIVAYEFLSEREAIPPQRRPALRAARNLPFPAVHDAIQPSIRPERHVASSIATIRRRLTAVLARSLLRCPCCTRSNHVRQRHL